LPVHAVGIGGTTYRTLGKALSIGAAFLPNATIRVSSTLWNHLEALFLNTNVPVGAIMVGRTSRQRAVFRRLAIAAGTTTTTTTQCIQTYNYN
jgi:hypothetical protein